MIYDPQRKTRQLVKRFEVDELGSPSTDALPDSPIAGKLHSIVGMLGRHGALMRACAQACEYEHRGGHSPQTQRRARHERAAHAFLTRHR